MVLTEHPIVSEPHKATMELSTTIGVALESLADSSLQFTLDFVVISRSSRLSVSVSIFSWKDRQRMGVRIEIEVFIYRERELVPHAWWFGDCKHRNVKKFME